MQKKFKYLEKIYDSWGPVYLLESSFLLKSEFQESEFQESELFFDIW